MDLVERDGLMVELHGEATRSRREQGRFVFLAGAAGVGKTSVVRAFAQQLRSNHRVLWGACDALSTPRTLGPIHDIAAGSPAWSDLLENAADRHHLFGGVLSELTDRPTLMVIEDVHWADESTLDLLRFLGRRIDATRSLAVATFRADELDTHHPLRPILGDLATAPGHRRLQVEPLTVEGVRVLAEGHAMDPEHLHTITGGNPFYVTEVLAAPGWTVPPTVTDAVLARAGRQPPEIRSVSESVSVEPGPTEHWLLERLGHDPASISDAADGGMLVTDGHTIAFRHELARLAMLGVVSSERRRRLHARFLAELEGVPRSDPARLSHHARGANDGGAVLRWATEAGETAASAGSHREAVSHFRDAAQHADVLDDTSHADLLTAYAAELEVLDRPVEAVGVRQRVVALRRSAGDTAGVEMARADLAGALWSAGESAAAYRLISEVVTALDRLPPGPATAHGYARAGSMAMLARRGPEAIKWSTRAVELANEIGEDQAMARALNALGSARLGSFGDLAGIEDLERSIVVADTNGWDVVHANALGNLGSGMGEIRHYEKAARYLVEGITYGAERDIDNYRHYCTAWLARVRFEQGAWDEAIELSKVALANRHGISPITPIVALTALGRVRARRGDPGGREALEEAWSLAQVTGDLQRLWPTVAARAELAWLDGNDLEPVSDDVASILGMARGLDIPWAIGELAFWAHRLGRLTEPPPGAAEPYRLSIAGDHAGAADAWELIGCPYEQAWARADIDDEPSLRAALDTLIGLGSGPLADRLRQRLRHRGATSVPTGPRVATAHHPAGLTPRQAEVLDLLSDGLTDRQIAERLYISPKTAGHHVAAILRKLGVANRGQAVARMPRPAGTPPDEGADSQR